MSMTEVLHPYVDGAKEGLKYVTVGINVQLHGTEAWQIVLGTFLVTIIFIWIWNFIFDDESLVIRSKRVVFKLVRKLPFVRKRIEQEMKNTALMAEKSLELYKNVYIVELPRKGWSDEKVVKEATEYLAKGHFDWEKGYISGTVYNCQEKLTQVTTKVYSMAVWTNPLHSEVFPGVRRMEAEVVRIVCNLFHGGPESCGTMTSGGTESILMACKAYRGYANENGIKKPEILCAITAHAAFAKAAEYFKMKIKYVPVDPVTMRADVKAMKRAITRSTCMLVGSCPGYPHGVMDSIEEIAALGVKYNIPVHVDACLGGFLIPFMNDAGFPLPPFDFQLKGVTSVSADTHKYGFAPKGSSVILYSDKKYRSHQFFYETNWPGGIYASPSIAGSRSGGIIAGCWSSLMYHGYEGYKESTRKIVSITRYIEKGLRDIKGIEILGKPEVSVVAFTSTVCNIYQLSDFLKNRGWHLNPLQFPSGIHICCTYVHTVEGVGDRFITDVQDGVAELTANPPEKISGEAAIYGLAQRIPDRTLISDMICVFLNTIYKTGEARLDN